MFTPIPSLLERKTRKP